MLDVVAQTKEGTCPVTGQSFSYHIDQIGTQSTGLASSLDSRHIGRNFLGVQMRDGSVIWSKEVPNHHALVDAEDADWQDNVGRFQAQGGNILKPPAINILILKGELPETLTGYLLDYASDQRTRLTISYVDQFPVKNFTGTAFRGDVAEYRQGVSRIDSNLEKLKNCPHLYGRIFTRTVGRLFPTNTHAS